MPSNYDYVRAKHASLGQFICTSLMPFFINVEMYF